MSDKPKKIIKSGKVVIGSAHMVTIDGATQSLTVRPKCDGAKPMCITHGERFDSARALSAHTADKKDHLTGWWCDEPIEESRGPDAMGQAMVVTGPHGLESDREIEA